MSKPLVRILIFIAIGLIVLVFVFYAGRRSANADAKVKVAEEKAKTAETKAKQWQDSAKLFRANWKTAEDPIPGMTRRIDSLEKRRMVNITSTTYLPVVKYKKGQLDSIWRKAFD